jgi:hypothetical protein
VSSLVGFVVLSLAVACDERDPVRITPAQSGGPTDARPAFGDPSGPAGPETPPGIAGPGTAPVPGSPLGPGAGLDAGAPAACGPGPRRLRRLTAEEYENTLVAVLPMVPSAVAPRVPWPQSPRRLGREPADDDVRLLEAGAYLETALAGAEQLHEPLAGALLASGCGGTGAPADAEACARGLAAQLGRVAYRRPLEREEVDILAEAFRAGRATSVAQGVMALAAALLSAPQLVYHAELGQADATVTAARPTPYDMAARLSYFLWAAPPEEATVAAALTGRLDTPAQVAAEARRLLADPRARGLPTRLATEWLPLSDLETLERDPRRNPTFTPAVRGDMRRELDRFVEHHFWETPSDLTGLLTAPHTFVTPALAAHYDLPRPAGAPDSLTRVELPPERRGGLLTQGALMTSLAWSDTPSAIRRGVFVLRALFCMALPPPPANLDVPPPGTFSPNATTRQRLEKHAKDPSCAACHALIDPIGFAFEGLDATGRLRDTDNGQPVDTRGRSRGLNPDVAFTGAMDLARQAATHPGVRACVARTWLEYGLGRPVDPVADACSLAQVSRRFADAGFRLRDLVAGIVESDAFTSNRPPKETP